MTDRSLNRRARREAREPPSSLAAYLEQAGRHPLLTRSEEVQLAKRIAVGDRLARETLVLANLRLVVSLAKRYWLPPGSSLGLMDLVQEGTVGLIRAAELYDWRQNVRFSTYASFWIRQSIAKALALNGVIRVPVAVRRQIRAIARAEQELRGRLGREPTDEEVAAAVPISLLELAAIRIRTSVLSLDSPVAEDATLAELLASSTDASMEVERRLTARALRERVSELPERLREIVILHYGLAADPPMSLARIGRRLGLSRERVRQLEGRALAELLHRSTPREGARRRVDGLRAFDPLTWLATLKAGLIGPAASAVATSMIATATVTSVSWWHGPMRPSPMPASEAAQPKNPSGQPRSPLSTVPRSSRTTRAPLAEPAKRHESPPPEAPAQAPAATDNDASEQLSGPPSIPHSEQVEAPPPTSSESSSRPANPPAQPAPRTEPTGDARVQPNADVPPESDAGTGPPRDAGGPSDTRDSDGPPPHAGRRAQRGQGVGGPPPHAGPPTSSQSGVAALDTPPGYLLRSAEPGTTHRQVKP